MSNMLLETKRLLTDNNQWSELKAKMLDGLNERDARFTGIILENSRPNIAMMLENASMGATSAGNIAMLPKVILPVIRRVAPTVIANEIMGVQPMGGPLSYVRTVRFRYAESVPGGVTAGSEALAPLDIAREYAGNGDVNNPAAAPTSSLEGTGGRAMNLQTLNKAVEAGTRKLRATWTFESQQDAMAQVGIDVEQEHMNLLAQELVAEIDQEMLGRLRRIPGAPSVTYDQNAVSGVGAFVGDEHAALATLILRQANLIAQRTRMGAGNWVVVSPTAQTILQSGSTSALARTTDGVFDAPSNVKFVGVLNQTMRVYCDAYADDATPVMVGLKQSDINAAAFYCPYIPLMATPVVINPVTFEQTVSFMSRYGYCELTNTADSLGNSADYLGLIGVNATNLRFQ